MNEALRAYYRERPARNRREWMEANGPCAKCGSWQDLEVDHIDPATKDPAMRYPYRQSLWTWAPERRTAELAKCQVLCVKCHKAKTREAWRKDECVNGHEMTPENTWIPPADPGVRRCKVCKNIQRWGKKGRYGENARA